MKTLIILAVLLLQSPPVVSKGAILPPAPLGAATKLLARAIANLPAWEADDLAQFEQPELVAVRADIEAAVYAETNDDFLIDVEQLKIDVDKLVSLDDALATNERVI